MAAIARTHLFGAPSFQLREAELHFARFSSIHKRLGDYQRNVALTRKAGNATAILPKIRAENPAGTN